MPPAAEKLRCLVLNVDVGAGHRLAAQALREAIEALRPQSRFEIVELLAVGVPLIALKPLAGQEEANCAALVRRGAAVRADDADEAHAALTRLLHHPNELSKMRLAALRMGAPGSGRQGARKVLGLLG